MTKREQPHEKVAREHGVEAALRFYAAALRGLTPIAPRASEVIEQRIALAERDLRDFTRSLWIACADETAQALRDDGFAAVAIEVSEIADAFIDHELDSGNKQADNPDDAPAGDDDQEGEVDAEGN